MFTYTPSKPSLTKTLGYILTVIICATSSISIYQQVKNNTTTKKQLAPSQARVLAYQQGQVGNSSSSLPLGVDISTLQDKSTKSQGLSFTQKNPPTGIITMSTSVKNSVDNTLSANAYDYINLRYVHYDQSTKKVKLVKQAPPPGLFANDQWPKIEASNNKLSDLFPTPAIAQAIASTLGWTSSTNQSKQTSFSRDDWFNALNKPNLTLDLSNNNLTSIAEIFNPYIRFGLGIYNLVASVKPDPITQKVNYHILYDGIGTLKVDDNQLHYFPNVNFTNFPALKTISASHNQIRVIGNFSSYGMNQKNTGYLSDSEIANMNMNQGNGGSATSASGATPASSTKDKYDYYQYLKSLWSSGSGLGDDGSGQNQGSPSSGSASSSEEPYTYDASDVMNRDEVKAIMKWLTMTLPGKTYGHLPTTTTSNGTSGSSSGTIANGSPKTISDYSTFLAAISSDNFYFNNNKGEVYVNQQNGSSNANNTGNNMYDSASGIITDATGLISNRSKGLNFGSTRLMITKDINNIDFSHNQIEQISVSPNLFTNINFISNKLKYVPPLGIKPLPYLQFWFYHQSLMKVAGDQQGFYDTLHGPGPNPANWNKYYSTGMVNEKPAGFGLDSTGLANDKIQWVGLADVNQTLPKISFANNQLLDFWPQQKQTDSWYLWPKLTVGANDREGPEGNIMYGFSGGGMTGGPNSGGGMVGSNPASSNGSGTAMPQPTGTSSKQIMIKNNPTNVMAKPIFPWNNQIGSSSDNTTFNPYFRRIWVGANLAGLVTGGDKTPFFSHTYLGGINRDFAYQVADVVDTFDGANIDGLKNTDGNPAYNSYKLWATAALDRWIYAHWFNQLSDNEVLSKGQTSTYAFDFHVDESDSSRLVLPGFGGSTGGSNGTGLVGSNPTSPSTGNGGGMVGGSSSPSNDKYKQVGTSNFSDDDAYQSFNSFIPYLLTRTLPQNGNNQNSWGSNNGRLSGRTHPQKLEFKLYGDGKEITPAEWKDVDWTSFYANANGLDYDLSLPTDESVIASYSPGESNGVPNNNGNQGGGSTINNGTQPLTQLIGQLPYYNGRVGAGNWTVANGSSTTTKLSSIHPLGVDKKILKYSPSGSNSSSTDPSFYYNKIKLVIRAPLQNWNYSYDFNLVQNIDYRLDPKNGGASSTRTFDVKTTTNLKNYFASTITSEILKNHLSEWADTSAYVKNFISQQVNVINVKSVDENAQSVTLSFDVKDQFNQKVKLVDITLSGFKQQKVEFVAGGKQQGMGGSNSASSVNPTRKIVADFNSDQNNYPNQFVPEDEDAARQWIYTHFGISFVGLEVDADKRNQIVGSNGGQTPMNNNLTTSSVIANSADPLIKDHQVFLLDYLTNKDQYVSNIIIDHLKGKLSFSIQISGSSTNGFININQNISINTFNVFDYEIKPDQANKSLSAYDYQLDIKKLQPLVLLKQGVVDQSTGMIKQQQGGTNSQTWSKDQTSEDLVTAKLLPKNTSLKITNLTVDAFSGKLSFSVGWYQKNDDQFETLLKSVSRSIDHFNTTASVFEWIQTNDQRSNIAFIKPDGSNGTIPTDPSQFVAQLKESLKNQATAPRRTRRQVQSNASSTNSVNNLLLSLIKISYFNNNNQSSTNSTLSTTFLDDQKSQLVFGIIDANNSFTPLSSTNLAQAISVNQDANLLIIKNLGIKGGYHFGKFFAGNSSDANTPLTKLPNINVELNPSQTKLQVIGSSNNQNVSPGTAQTNQVSATSGFKDGTTIINTALNTQWKHLLPSEWLAQLRALKLNQANNTTNINYNDFSSLAGFLNHVLFASTAKPIYNTTVDLFNFSNIIINDATGSITIPANTLFVTNYFNSNDRAEIANANQWFSDPITFFLSNYFDRFEPKEKNIIPLEDTTVINNNLHNQNVISIISSFRSLLNQAKKVYVSNEIELNKLSPEQYQSSLDAINLLKYQLVNDKYYNNSIANGLFSSDLDSTTQSPKTTKSVPKTQFESITFDNIDFVNGSVNIKVKVKNAIQSFDQNNKNFQFVTATRTVSITNALKLQLVPNWTNFHPLTRQVVLNQDELNSLTFSVFGVVQLQGLNTISAQNYFEQLRNKTNNQVIDLSDNQLPNKIKLSQWGLIDSSGLVVSDQELENGEKSQLEQAREQLEMMLTSFGIKPVINFNDVYYSNTSQQLIFNQPYLMVNQGVEVEKIKKVIFDVENPVLSNGKYYHPNFGSVVLEGFKKEQIVVRQKQVKPNQMIDLLSTKVSLDQILPSDLLNWLYLNYMNVDAITTFLRNFLSLSGFSSLVAPLNLVLEQKLIDLLANHAPAEQLKQYLVINDGTGQFAFTLDAIKIVNSYQTDAIQRSQSNTNNPINPNPVSIQPFLAQPATNNKVISLQLKSQNSFVVTDNTNKNGPNLPELSSNSEIRRSIADLTANNFAQAYNYWQLNPLVANNTNSNQQLVIKQIRPSLVTGQVVIDYEINNGYLNGKQVKQQSGSIVVNLFASNTKTFVNTHLPWLLVLLVLMIVFFGMYIKYYYDHKNTLSYSATKKRSFFNYYLAMFNNIIGKPNPTLIKSQLKVKKQLKSKK
ncbi:hypothetical protein MCAV_08160 [[Mycoplasma] cavipharyngis]|uniref:hypothetical protein n=1 Tax=[Mycoplasma] cavipharyngis TaxID=92757 RepID=UPI003704680A